MAHKIKNRDVFAIVSETTQNTPATVTATDYALAIDPMPDQEVEKIEQDYARTTLDPLPDLSGKKSGKIQVSIPFRGSLASNTANAPLLAMLKAMGFAVSGGTGAADWTVAPIDAAPSNMQGPATSATVNAIMDGLLHAIPGVIGNGKMTFKAGEMGILAFSGQGLDAAITDVASWPTSPTVTPISVTPPIMESAVLKIDNATGNEVNEIEIDTGNTISMYDDVSAVTGVGGFQITAKKPKISLTVLARTVAAYDFWNKYRASTQINTGSVGLQFVLGTAAMNKFTFTIPTLQIKKCSHADVGGLRAFKLELNPTFTNGADWMNIVIDNA